MKKLLLGMGFLPGLLAAQVEHGGVFSGDGLKSFYLAVGSYYRVPEREIIVIRERAIPPEEIPVVLYVAQCARVPPPVIIDLRRRGTPWCDIAHHYGVQPEAFYFHDGPPYGKAWGHRKKAKKLRDIEVIDAVNVRFLSGYHGVPPEAIWAERSKGKSYVALARWHDEDEDGDRRGKHHGKGHGKGYRE